MAFGRVRVTVSVRVADGGLGRDEAQDAAFRGRALMEMRTSVEMPELSI